MARFTDTMIKSLQPKDKPYDIREGSGEGFAIRVHPTGRKSFCTWYTWQGQKRRLTHGVYPRLSLKAARLKHIDTVQNLAQGIDPIAKRLPDPQQITVAEFVDEYITVYAKPKKRSWQVDYRVLHKDLIPRLGKRSVNDVSTRDITLLLDRVRGRDAPYAAEQLLQILKRLFGVAVERGVIRPEQNPAQYVRSQVRVQEVERVLNDAEIVIAWRLLEYQHVSIRNAMRFMLLTASRVNEAAQMPWAEIEGDIWRLPASRAKQKREHVRPLSEAAQVILAQQRPITHDYVFSVNSNEPQSRDTVASALRRQLKKQHPEIPAFTPHDLRRTFRTWAEREGVNPVVAERVLGHSLGKLTRVYNRHSYIDEMRSTLEAWAQHISKLLANY